MPFFYFFLVYQFSQYAYQFINSVYIYSPTTNPHTNNMIALVLLDGTITIVSSMIEAATVAADIRQA
jgi:hypothetical protein